jgi:TetR/AcrR family fatty acid metabolism transcriptional regulator
MNIIQYGKRLTMPALMRDDTRDKRQAILAAAGELFASQGYDETTIAEIARAAGVAVGTVYLYFQSKHDILIDICLALNAEVAKVIQSPAILALPLQQVPRAVIEAAFRSGREHLRLMAYFQVEAQSPGEVLRLRASKQEIADSLEAYFRHIIAEGQVAPFETAAYAALLNTLVSATLQQCFAIEHGEREAFYREGVIELIERLFFGPPVAAGRSDSAASPTDTD